MYDCSSFCVEKNIKLWWTDATPPLAELESEVVEKQKDIMETKETMEKNSVKLAELTKTVGEIHTGETLEPVSESVSNIFKTRPQVSCSLKWEQKTSPAQRYWFGKIHNPTFHDLFSLYAFADRTPRRLELTVEVAEGTLNRSAEVLQTITPISKKVEKWANNMRNKEYSTAAYEQAVLTAGEAGPPWSLDVGVFNGFPTPHASNRRTACQIWHAKS